MPKGIIKTPEQEKKWEKAKEVAAKQGKPKRWPLIMAIFKQMGGMSKADNDRSNMLIERALASQGKKTAIPQEAHEILHSWWQNNRDRLLSAKQKQGIANIKSVKEKRSKIGLVKSQEYLNEISAAFLALKNQLSEELAKADEDRSSGDWSQHPDHTPEELDKIAKLVEAGYHPREAAHMISPTTGGRGEPKDFMRALQSYIRPTQLSPKMHAEAKRVAQQWLENYESHLAERAKPEINPVMHASSKLKQAHEEKTADYHKAYTDLLASDELKGKSPIERHKAIQAWKQNWKQKNPDHQTQTPKLSEATSKFKEAEEARKKYVQEAKHHLVHGSAPIEPTGAEEEVESATPMSARAISEHMGMGGSEEGEAPKISAKQDPSAKFASANKKYIESVLRPQVGEAKPAPVKPAPAQSAPAPEKPKTIIRRMAKPDQQERIKHIDAAKMSLSTKKD